MGQVYGLLGANGAGKTTLIRTLLGFIRPTRGTALIGGFDVVRESLQVREQVSYLPADARLYRSMRGTQVLELFAGLHCHGDLKRSQQVAKRLELDVHRRVMFMSTGMRQKLAIAVVLGCDAPLVILDEPTANLDPNVRSEVLALIREIRERGNTVLLSSHIFSDIDEACDQVGVIRAGQLVAEQDIAMLQQLHIVQANWRRPESSLPSGPLLVGEPLIIGEPDRSQPSFVESYDVNDSHVTLQLSGSPSQWLPWLAAQSLDVLNIEKGGIEAVYNRYAHAAIGDQTIDVVDLAKDPRRLK